MSEEIVDPLTCRLAVNRVVHVSCRDPLFVRDLYGQSQAEKEMEAALDEAEENRADEEEEEQEVGLEFLAGLAPAGRAPARGQNPLAGHHAVSLPYMQPAWQLVGNSSLGPMRSLGLPEPSHSPFKLGV
jgi:hypothetical protein